MGPIDALKMALAEETKAAEMYRSLAEKYPAAREIFEFLHGEEYKHKIMIEKKIVDLTR